jgi:penicillin-binding protein 2
MDPQNGEILAMASNPTFDPDVYTAPVDPAALRWLARPGANAPTLNRATQGLYPPGSTFKPVTALAAVAEDVLSPYEYVHCGPSMLVNGQRFRNWNPNVNTPMALETAIASSCDTYFYSVGLRFYDLPPERGSPLQRWAHRFGIGRPTGTDLGHEEAGLLPTPKWRKSHFRSPIDRLWKPGDSIQLAIGQGDLLVTPLQMTRFYAMIANGGRLVTPHVAQQLERSGGGARAGQVLQRFAPPRPDAVALNPAALAALRRGLVEATHAQYGTSAGVFAGFPVVVAGKTGTAEKFISVPGYKGLADQAWWCGYAPADDPRLVVCAVIENGGFGGEAAAPAALRVFERFFRVRAKLVRPADYD